MSERDVPLTISGPLCLWCGASTSEGCIKLVCPMRQHETGSAISAEVYDESRYTPEVRKIIEEWAARTEPLLDSIREIGVIRPGDTLLLSTEAKMTAEEVGRIQEAVKDEMPGVNVVVVTGLKATVLRDD